MTPTSPDAVADAGAGSADLTEPSNTAPTPPATSTVTVDESDVPTSADTELPGLGDAGLEPPDAGDAGDDSHSEASSSETIPALEAGVGDADAF